MYVKGKPVVDLCCKTAEYKEYNRDSLQILFRLVVKNKEDKKSVEFVMSL